jgi:hypothetical protein
VVAERDDYGELHRDNARHIVRRILRENVLVIVQGAAVKGSPMGWSQVNLSSLYNINQMIYSHQRV